MINEGQREWMRKEREIYDSNPLSIMIKKIFKGSFLEWVVNGNDTCIATQ